MVEKTGDEHEKFREKKPFAAVFCTNN